MAYVTITIGGHYLRLHEAGGDPRLWADGRAMEADATFERVELGHGRIALRTLDGRYLTMRPDHHQNFGLYPEPELTPAAAFEEVLWPTGQVSLRSSELTYVGVQVRGRTAVTVNRTEPALTERFFFVPVPAAMVPRQRGASDADAGSDVEAELQPVRRPTAPAAVAVTTERPSAGTTS
jgi:hypothetical protein